MHSKEHETYVVVDLSCEIFSSRNAIRSSIGKLGFGVFGSFPSSSLPNSTSGPAADTEPRGRSWKVLLMFWSPEGSFALDDKYGRSDSFKVEFVASSDERGMLLQSDISRIAYFPRMNAIIASFQS